MNWMKSIADRRLTSVRLGWFIVHSGGCFPLLPAAACSLVLCLVLAADDVDVAWLFEAITWIVDKPCLRQTI